MIRIFKVAERLVCAFKLCVNVSKWPQTEQLHVGERKQERWRKENKKEQIKSPTVDFFFFSLQSVLAVSIFPSCSNSQWENLASRKTLERRQIPDWVRFYSSLVGFPVRDILAKALLVESNGVRAKICFVQYLLTDCCTVFTDAAWWTSLENMRKHSCGRWGSEGLLLLTWQSGHI